MAIPADAAGAFRRPRAALDVLCASCGSRFETGAAGPGDRVRCPLCREVVAVARLIAARRRVRHTGDAAGREPRRVSRAEYRRMLRHAALWTAAALSLAALWSRRDSIRDWVEEGSRAGPETVKPR